MEFVNKRSTVTTIVTTATYPEGGQLSRKREVEEKQRGRINNGHEKAKDLGRRAIKPRAADCTFTEANTFPFGGCHVDVAAGSWVLARPSAVFLLAYYQAR